ncbi:hypothetical protein [Streptomyces turgidiscabies]|uniref:Ig-like domain-containing protein n=1 Tax=Streptomyces turgidiscabies TaxID=85558 RepID=A0ABU0RVR7_9ACTN|nr:hypothetical protein [Streptomyces turgidiscabies]MDQ0935252.1 hypothetical protein [Streptomyces turgidiscabies]
MVLTTRRPRAAAVALTAALTALTVGSALPATAAGYTASAGPWTAAATLTGAEGQQSLIDVKAAGDGTVFALWLDKAAGATTWDVQAAVKPAGGNTWGAPHTLSTGRGKNAEADLAVTADGHAVVTWLDGDSGALADLAATWDPAQGSWSAPAPLTAYDGSYLSPARLAAAADGTLTAIWTQGDGSLQYQVMTATRAPGALSWSAPEPLGSNSSGYIYDLSVTVAPDGAATAAWDAYGFFTGDHAVTTATRASAGGGWSSAAVLPGTDDTSGHVQVTMDAKDATTVLWRTNIDGNDGSGDLKSATRTAPSGAWGAAQTVTAAFRSSDTSEPLAAPDGDVTYVWAGWSSTAGEYVVRAVTRSAGTGAWSAPKTLSTGYVNAEVSASIGADGTVQAVWPQTPSIDNGDDHYLQWAVRADGTWSTATALSSVPVPAVPNTAALSGEVAAGPDGRATVMWRKAVYASPASYTSQVWTQSQTLLAKPQITSKATLSGTARTGSKLTCAAAWTGYGSSVAWSWLRDGKTVSGATGKTRTLTSTDYTHKVSCRAIVTNRAAAVTSTSTAVTVTVGPALKPTTVPVVTGTPKVGTRLTAAHGTWSPAATSYTYAWKRDGTAITGATKSTYVPVRADKGHKLTVKVTAHRYAWTNGSATTAAVTVR